MNRLIVLRSGIDTLEATFTGKLSAEMIGALDHDRIAAREEPMPWTINGREFFIEPKGRGKYPYVLRNPDLDICLTTSAHIPTALVHLSALGLATLGPEALFDEAWHLAAELGAPEEKRLSRIDVARDFQGGWVPVQADFDHVTCRAKKNRLNRSGTTVETASYGERPMMLRVYNKTLQAREQKKGWWPVVWESCEGYDPSADVWRVESEIASAVLKQLGIDRAHDGIERAAHLLDYAMGSWCKLRTPTGDKIKSRWPEHPAWEQIRTAEYVGEPLKRARVVHELMSYDVALAYLVTATATGAARLGGATFQETVERMGFDAERMMEHKGIDFAARVNEQRYRIAKSG